MDAVMAGCESESVEVVVLDRPNPHRRRPPRGRAGDSGVRVLRVADPDPHPPRPDPRRDRPAAPARTLPAARARRGPLPPLVAEVVVGRDRIAMGPSEPQHADPRDRRHLPGALSRGGHHPLRRARHHAAVPPHRSSVGRMPKRRSTALRRLDLPGIAFRAARFRPQFGKHAGQVCAGVELHVTDRETLEPVALGLHLLKVFHDLHPNDFAWRAEPYEFVSDVPALDLLTGSPEARECIESGAPFDHLFEAWEKLGRDLRRRSRGYLLVPPLRRSIAVIAARR